MRFYTKEGFIFAIFFLLFVMSGCDSPSVVDNLDISAVQVSSLQFTPLELPQQVFRPRQLLLQRESGIITYFDDVEAGIFKVFSYPDNKFLFRYPEEENERDESSFIDESTMESFPDRIRYLDYPFLRDVVIDTTEKKFVHKSYLDLSKINQEMHSVLQLNDTLFSARNAFSQGENSEHFLFSTKNNSIVDFFGNYPEVNIFFEDAERKSSFFRYRPVVDRGLERLMIFYVKINKLRIYDFDGNLLKDINVGPFILSQKQEEQRVYFESPVAVGDKVYVLYVNKNHNGVNSNPEGLRPELQIYNWDGELLERYAMDASVYKYAVDPTSGKIIGVTFSEEKPVVEALLSPL